MWPAVPNTSVYADHRNAASVPIDTSVSMVTAPWRRFTAAARWNGQAPQSTTGAASASETHCHCGNCSAGTIASAITGTARTALTMSRSRSPVSSASAPAAGSLGAGMRAV